MRLLSRTIVCLLIATGAADLKSQDSGEFILAARRTGIAELIDPATLETVSRIHFDFDVERLSSSADGSTLYVDGYRDRGCCQQYALDPSTLNLKEVSSIRRTYVNPQLSPDGRWRFELRSFQFPSLKMFDLLTGAAREFIPSGLPLTEEQCGGNWYAQGVWSGDRFQLYVACPKHPGFLWTILPGSTQLGVPVAVAPFAEAPDCRQPLPLERVLVADGDKLFLYEVFGGKGDRTAACRIPSEGGAWMLDPATGRVTRQIAAGLHFNRLLSNRSGSMLYGVDSGDGRWRRPVRLVAIDGQDYRVIKSRAFDAGVLQIAIGPLQHVPAGDVRVVNGHASF